MTQFQLALCAVLFVTTFNMFIASILALYGDPDNSQKPKNNDG